MLQINSFLSNLYNNINNEPKIKYALTACLIFGGSVIVYRSFIKNKRKKSYPKDKVILHQVPRGLRCPSMSPFALKLETWLRMAKIPYENEFSFQFSSKKLFPWVSYNDTDIADSQFSIEYLSAIFGRNLNMKLDSKQLAISRCVLKTCEESLRWCGVLHRFIYNPDPKECGLAAFILKLMKPRIKKYTYGQGYGRHSKEEVYEIGKADLKALNVIIGDNKFLFGDEPCETDAAIFGIIAQVYNHDRGPFNKFLIVSCPNLVRHYETMKETYWPDWNDNIREKSN